MFVGVMRSIGGWDLLVGGGCGVFCELVDGFVTEDAGIGGDPSKLDVHATIGELLEAQRAAGSSLDLRILRTMADVL